jgi:predicted phosphodiesterase
MIAIISDVHGNLPALESVLNAITELGCNRIISLGDVAGYYAQPGECIDTFREHDVLHLRGNHDEYLIKGTTCTRSKTVSSLIEIQRKLLSSDHLKWLAASPITYQEDDNYFVHGGWNDPIDEYLYKITESLLPNKGKRFFSGHTHVQILANLDKKNLL